MISSKPDPLFTPRFFVMCGFTFTVFLSAFQLLPTAPYRILDLGGSPFAAGLFLGFLTYASAFSAPVTGALADRLGKRRMLVCCSLAIAGFSVAYALATDYRLLLGFVLLHGVFWSGLLSASSAYMTDIIPEARRAEGIGYWGLATIVAVAVAPAAGFAVYHHGWTWLCAVTGALNLLMAAIALGLREDKRPHSGPRAPFFSRDLLEWRVLVVSFTLFLYSFGYGGITSFVALYADANHIAPKGIFFTVMSVVILMTRPLSGRAADRLGYKTILFPSLTLIAVGLALLAMSATRAGLVAAAIVFGSGFGSAYPAFAAYVMGEVDAARRGAAFGGILAAFDTGIGTGSILTGLIIDRFGYSRAYVAAAPRELLDIPVADRFGLQPLQPFPSEQHIHVHGDAAVTPLVQRHGSDQRVRNSLLVEQLGEPFQGLLNVGLAHQKPPGLLHAVPERLLALRGKREGRAALAGHRCGQS